jgi:hypothetical protein
MIIKNKLLRVVILSLTIMLQSCVGGGQPDCDDVDEEKLKYLITRQILYDFNEQASKDLHVLIEEWKEQEKIEPGFLKSKEEEYEDRVKIKRDSVRQSIAALQSTIEFSDNFLRFESENSSLTTFHCDCQITYKIDGIKKYSHYRLTRNDWDYQTYHSLRTEPAYGVSKPL